MNPCPPTISKEQGRQNLDTLLQEAKQLLANRPLKEGKRELWSAACRQTVAAIFGEPSEQLSTYDCWKSHEILACSLNGFDEEHDANWMERQCELLTTVIEQINVEIGFTRPAADALSFWADIHPQITALARSRYETNHFADAVESALKEVNAVVKDRVRRRTGKELDGADLMHTAFSPKSPIIILADQTTESGKNIQKGYMEIYAGVMTGIRNPEAHENTRIDDKRARHFLYLASLLLYKLDEGP